MFKKFIRDEKGAALLEYSLLAAGVALVSAAAVSVFGHKTNDMLGAVATVIAVSIAPKPTSTVVVASYMDGMNRGGWRWRRWARGRWTCRVRR